MALANMSNQIAIYNLSTITLEKRQKLFERNQEEMDGLIKQVKPIIDNVRRRGDIALCEYAEKFEGAQINPNELAATKDDVKNAYKELDDEFVEVMKFSAENIRKFHEQQMPKKSWEMEIQKGVKVGERITPIDSVACYNPRGKGSFPSVTLMSAIPAVVAGVKEIVILTPPMQDGRIDPATLVAADIAGVNKIYKMGGAQAVAAVAFGTESVPKCLKIEGPGNSWVGAAKIALQNYIDSGMPAGPSESIIFADETANGKLAALDTIIESEHGNDSSVFLVTTSQKIVEEAQEMIPTLWKEMSETRVGYSKAVLGGENGGIVLADNLEQAYEFINEYAPEHLQIMSENPRSHLEYIRNASEILLGQNTPGSVANYMMGPNCILPTAGAAKTYSPLQVHNFLKSSSIGEMTKEGLELTGPKTEIFAKYEGFDAHANAVGKLREKLQKE